MEKIVILFSAMELYECDTQHCECFLRCQARTSTRSLAAMTMRWWGEGLDEEAVVVVGRESLLGLRARRATS